MDRTLAPPSLAAQGAPRSGPPGAVGRYRSALRCVPLTDGFSDGIPDGIGASPHERA